MSNFYYVIYDISGRLVIDKIHSSNNNRSWPTTSLAYDKKVIHTFLCLKGKYRTKTFGYCKRISLGIFTESTDLKYFFREITFNSN